MSVCVRSLPLYEKASPDFSRLRKVLFREGKPDRAPLYELFANDEIIDAFFAGRDSGPAHWRFYAWSGYDHVPVWPEYDAPLGDLVDTSKPYPVKAPEDLAKYPWPEARDIGYQCFRETARAIPEGMRIVGQMPGPFEMAQKMVGFEQFCYLLYDEPEMVDAMFDGISSFYEAAYRGMARQEKVGALVISDDMGYKCGTLISAEHLRRYVKPIHRKLTRIAHEMNLPVILHSCGQLSEILGEWIDDVGFDAKHSFEDNAIGIEAFLRDYPGRAAALGGYDMNRLCADSPRAVYENALRLARLGDAGGYALGSGNSISAYVPVRNYLSMLCAGLALPFERAQALIAL